jgi:hypothetical protein
MNGNEKGINEGKAMEKESMGREQHKIKEKSE